MSKKQNILLSVIFIALNGIIMASPALFTGKLRFYFDDAELDILTIIFSIAYISIWACHYKAKHNIAKSKNDSNRI